MEITATSVIESAPIHDPPLFFRRAAVRVMQGSLVQVQTCGEVLSTPVRIQALHILDYALRMDNHWPLASELLLLLADKLEQCGYREGWLPFLQHGLQVSQQHNDHKSTAELHLRIGYLLQLSGKWEAACTHYTASVAMFLETGQPERQARVLNRYAFTALQQQKRVYSWQLVDKALHLVTDNHPERANALLVRGWIAFDERNWRETCDCFAEAIPILKENGTRYQLACALRDLAVPLHMLNRDTEAIACFQQATDLFAQLGNRFQQAVVSMNWGIIYLVRQQIAQALNLFTAAEPVFRQLHDIEHLSKLYLNQAIAYRAIGELSRSVLLLHAGIELFEQIGNLDWLANALDELGVTLLQMGDRKQAIATFQEALTVLSASSATLTYRRSQIAGHLQSALQANLNHAVECNL